MKRTDYCGSLRERDIGRVVTCCGWVQNRRDMGGVIFLDLGDREGTVQVVANVETARPEDFALFDTVRLQSVLQVSGPIVRRDEETINRKIATGTVELRVEEALLLSAAEPLPFSPDDLSSVREDLRLKYRFLDLRRPRLQKNLRLRHEVVRAIRTFMDQEGFLDVETPMLTKSTPEGARDYLVPSRVHPGHFYALPQSPQIFKQLLMVAGVDRYYQLARCFRDEDLRADRQPEFTQLDLEMSFVEQEDVLSLLERALKHVMRRVTGLPFKEAFPRLSWQEAMDRYGSDKPDLRNPLFIVDISELVADCGFSVFSQAVADGGVVRAIRLPGQADLPRSEIDQLTRFAMDQGAKGMAWIAWRPDGEIYSILTKFMADQTLRELLAALQAEPGDFVVFAADRLPAVRQTTGALRTEIARRLKLIDEKAFAFLIVTEFPMFEYSEEEKRFVAQHHPFTMPYLEDLPFLESQPERVRSQAYDVVLNGVELGSGSIRIHDSQIQHRVFSALGFADWEIEERFGFMLNAFRYGTPPHGGFAFGFDRLVMLLAGEPSLREVVAFPKVKDASDLLTGAPGAVGLDQLEALGLRLADQTLEAGAAAARGPQTPRFELDRMASLARLEIADSERQDLDREMAHILSFVSAVADAAPPPPADDGEEPENVFQDPTLAPPPVARERLLQNAAATEDGCFLVPEVLA